jgi:polyisoprenoid-binding protein YceI
MKTIVPLLAISLAFAPAQAAETYRIDPVHSSIGFKIKHLYSKVTGRFADVNGTIAGDPAKPEEAQVNVEIKTASIDTGDQKRDEHLRSSDFFDVELFPTMKFVSKKVNRTGEDTAFVIGDLTMHGVTKECILQVTFQGKGKDAKGAIRTGWEARTALKRSDFGLTWGKAVEGTQVVSDDVEIELNIEAVDETGIPSSQLTSTGVPTPGPAAGIPPVAPPATGEPSAVSAPAAVQVPLPFVFLTPEQKAEMPPAPEATVSAPVPVPAPTAESPAPAPTTPPVAPAAPAVIPPPVPPVQIAPQVAPPAPAPAPAAAPVAPIEAAVPVVPPNPTEASAPADTKPAVSADSASGQKQESAPAQD